MEMRHYKAILAAVWVLAITTMGLVMEVTSLPRVAVLVGIAVLPPMVMMWLWQHPTQSLSESIHQARR